MPVAGTPEERREYNRRNYRENRAARDAYSTAWREKQRLSVIDKLGGKCAHCGITDTVVLHIDHVNDDGCKDKSRKQGYAGFISRILKEESPFGKYQLLCCNCNWRKEYFRRKKCRQ